MEPLPEDDSQICYWFERVPHEIRKVLMSNLDLGSFLNLMQCSFQFHQELHEDSKLILDRYRFDLSLYHRNHVFEIMLKCDIEICESQTSCYEGFIKFTKLSENSTEIKIRRVRFPHRSVQSPVGQFFGFKKSETSWIEDKNVNDLAVQYFTSYFTTFGKYLYRLSITVDSTISARMSQLFVNVAKLEKLLEFRLKGSNITFDQLMKMKAKEIILSKINWTKTEVLDFLKIWRDGELNPNISILEICAKFNYDEEIETYIKGYMSPLNCYGAPGVVYAFSRPFFKSKIIVNRVYCTIWCDFTNRSSRF